MHNTENTKSVAGRRGKRALSPDKVCTKLYPPSGACWIACFFHVGAPTRTILTILTSFFQKRPRPPPSLSPNKKRPTSLLCWGKISFKIRMSG
jgi:hypothetical protein